MTSYSHDRNSVDSPLDIPFEISKEMPQRTIICEQVDLEWVRSEVRENPLITLRELSELIHRRFGVEPSVSHVERILRLSRISRIASSRAKQVAA
jgi:hypothetical protein